jgi:hypothetical protein
MPGLGDATLPLKKTNVKKKCQKMQESANSKRNSLTNPHIA